MRVSQLIAAAVLVAGLAPCSDLDARVARELPSLVDLYRELHAYPEISYQEGVTAARVAKELRDAGFEVTERFGDYADRSRVCYGVVGVLKNGAGPTVYVRTDLDGLPVAEATGLPYASKAKGRADDGSEVATMHACGHDVHMSVAVGAARVLASMRSEWKGTLVFLGQPSEERAPGGAQAMLRGGLYAKFPKPDAVLGLHCAPDLEHGKVGFTEGFALAAVDSVDITVRGVGGHGAYPHATKDPIVIASQIVVALQTIVSREIPPGEPAVVTVGSIHGGTKRNVIPEEVKLELTVRSYAKETRAKLLSAIERIATQTARAAGVPADREPVIDLHPDQFIPATFNEPALVRRASAAMRRELGDVNVVERKPTLGSEDFAFYTLEDHSVAAFQMWLGTIDAARIDEAKKVGKPLPSLHSPLYAPVPEPSIRTGVRAMAAAVLDRMRG